MLVRFGRYLPLALIAVLGFWLRTHDLSVRPMHSDEANQAVKAGELLEHGRYVFDPHDHHGPTLYYAVLPLAWLRGETTLATLRETTVRFVPVFAGTLAIVMLTVLAAPLGRWNALAAAAFLAISPPAVYYSRYFIQETLLTTFFLAALIAARAWWRSGRLPWAITAGVCVGLMQATKASTPLFVVAAALALLGARPASPIKRRWSVALACACASAALVAAVFYSSFGTHLSGLGDAFAVYGPAANRAIGIGATGHEKPWWYYLRLFGWHREGGLLWQQIAFSALALCGAALAFIRRPHANDQATELRASSEGGLKLTRWAAIYTTLIAIALSITPYKTPWHVIHLVPGLAILAAGALSAFPSWRRALIVTGVVLVMQYSQVKLAVFFRPTDARNPYAYVHSSPDVLKFRPLVDSALAASPNGVVRVVGQEYWPLPWYLRGIAQVGYWSAAPGDCDGAVIIATGEQADVVRSRLRGNYRESLLGLRPGVLCTVFTRQP